jgi:hypothetical protein
MRDQLKYSTLRAGYGCPAFKEPFITPRRSPTGELLPALNFPANYGCPALKQPSLSLETALSRKAFLVLNCQADYGCPINKPFLAPREKLYRG